MINSIDSLGKSTVITGSQRGAGESSDVEKEKADVSKPVFDEVSARLMTQIATGGSSISTVEEAWTAIEKIKETISENRSAAIGAQGTQLAEDILSRMGLS